MSATLFIADHEVIALRHLTRNARAVASRVVAKEEEQKLTIWAETVEGLLDRIAAITDGEFDANVPVSSCRNDDELA